MELLSELDKLVGQTLKTIDQGHKFTIYEVSEGKVIITVESTGKKRRISIEEICGSLELLSENHKITRKEINQKTSARNPAYVVSILAKITGAKISSNPIALFLN